MKEEIFQHRSSEYIIWIGENKHDNFEMIDQSSTTDIWFHVESIPSCHVILKTSEKMRNIPNQVIKRCAYLCKLNSKTRNQPVSRIMYTTIDNIRKTNVVGTVEVNKYKTIDI